MKDGLNKIMEKLTEAANPSDQDIRVAITVFGSNDTFRSGWDGAIWWMISIVEAEMYNRDNVNNGEQNERYS